MGIFDKLKINKEEGEIQPHKNPETGTLQPPRAWKAPPEAPRSEQTLKVHQLPQDQVTNHLRAIKNVQQDGIMYLDLDDVVKYIDSLAEKQGTDQAGTGYRKLLAIISRDLKTYREKMQNI